LLVEAGRWFMDKQEKKAAIIIAGIAGVEGIFVLINFVNGGMKFARFLGFGSDDPGAVLGWVLAIVATVVFVGSSAVRLPSVRENMLRPSLLKVLAILLAIFAGILEELVFRKLLMNALDVRGYGVLLQILASGLAFGGAHAIWGLMGRNLQAALGAMVATSMLGFALAVVYIAAGRNLAPCILAHFVINLLIEPGLVLAAVRGEFTGNSRSAPAGS
jgi:membrane protease YdiL (CAAX protease family)